MSEHHHFRLKLPNGAEVDFGGDKDFVAQVYRDTKTAAVTLFNREASLTSTREAVDRLMSPTDGAIPLPRGEPQFSTLAALPDASLTDGGAAPTNPGKGPKPRKASAKRDPAQAEAKKAREALIDRILSASAFDDDASYVSALKNADNPLDRAALVSSLAHEKFQVETGLSPAEVLRLLNDRFRVGQEESSLKKAMKAAPGSFFVDGPASHDKRARLYRPMNDCFERAGHLLTAGRSKAPGSQAQDTASK